MAALQAKVEDLRATAQQLIDNQDILEGERDVARREAFALSAEAERLKTENAQASAACTNLSERGGYWKQRATTAESRLAATTEALDAIRDGRRFRGEHTPEAIAKVALALEGDAPQEASDDRPYPQRAPHVFVPIGDNPAHCGALTASGNRCGWFAEQHKWPCSDTCTHDDAATPGHPERVKERSEAWKAMHPTGSCTCAGEGTCEWCDRMSAKISVDASRSEDDPAEAMRSACLSIALNWAKEHGFIHGGAALVDLKNRIEGVAP